MPESRPYEETCSVLPPRLAAPDQQSQPPLHPQSEEGEAVKIQVCVSGHRSSRGSAARDPEKSASRHKQEHV